MVRFFLLSRKALSLGVLPFLDAKKHPGSLKREEEILNRDELDGIRIRMADAVVGKINEHLPPLSFREKEVMDFPLICVAPGLKKSPDFLFPFEFSAHALSSYDFAYPREKELR